MTIDGVPLTLAQVMTLRVAVSSFLTDLGANGLGDDVHGETMARLYIARGSEVEAMLARRAPQNPEDEEIE